jgi:hypothetical protein
VLPEGHGKTSSLGISKIHRTAVAGLVQARGPQRAPVVQTARLLPSEGVTTSQRWYGWHSVTEGICSGETPHTTAVVQSQEGPG